MTDTFVQEPAPVVDLLFVVDNSGSMTDNQALLGEAGPSLLSAFLGSGIDWHIGVVSTDLDDPTHSGKLREVDGHRWVEESTPSTEAVFADMVAVGASGSHSEQGFGAIQAALDVEVDQYNAGFLRDDSELQVIVLSDERDFSRGLGGFQAWFDGLRDQGPTMSAIVPTSGMDRATSYISVAERTGGLIADVAIPDYFGVLGDLGAQATLGREFFLSEDPWSTTLEVSIEADGGIATALEGVDFEYDSDRNSVQFHFVPAEGSVVTVSYDRHL